MPDAFFDQLAVGRAVVGAYLRDQTLLEWVAGGAYSLTSIVRDSNDALVSGTVHWPNGETGMYQTLVASTAFPGAVDSFSLTYTFGANGLRTITQPQVARDANGAISAQPALVLS